jgi:hypothetical protein
VRTSGWISGSASPMRIPYCRPSRCGGCSWLSPGYTLPIGRAYMHTKMAIVDSARTLPNAATVALEGRAWTERGTTARPKPVRYPIPS